MEEENIIRPSLLACDFLHLEEEIQEMISLNITHCHFDVMDGSFVNDISFGKSLFDFCKKYQNEIIFDIHLMTINPIKQVENFISYGAKEICFHFEAITNRDFINYNLLREKHNDIKFGLAISPETSVDEIKMILSKFDYVLVMSVVPGKGGQKFIDSSLNKIASLNKIRKENNLNFSIGVDGGINSTTSKLCLNNGADFLVAGSYYFKADDKSEALKSLHS